MSSGWDRFAHLDDRTPVVVGAAQASQHVVEVGEGRSAIELMVEATRRAGGDSGSPTILSRIERVAVPEGSWKYTNAPGLVARAIGAPNARTVVLTAGIPQQTPLDTAYRDMLAGRLDIALVVGGEAARRTALAKRAGVEIVDEDSEAATAPDEVHRPSGEMISAAEIAVAAYAPAVQFALIDSALRFAEGKSIDAQRDEIAELWATFSRVASTFEHAAFPEVRSAEFLRDASADNRPIAFPYNKWHCSQMNVDQAAAVLVSTLRAARAHGVDPSRLVFPSVALESSFTSSVLSRRDLHRWPAMEVLAARAEAHLGMSLRDIEHVELYSCFPAAVRVQQRALRMPPERTVTITGGEPFGGGPWNNFVLQSTVAMIDALRDRPGERGAVTSVSGFLNKPALAIYSTDPNPDGVLVADLAAEAEAATPMLPVLVDHHGPATIAACTVSYERSGDRTIVFADTSSGGRCAAASTDPAVARLAEREELVGRSVHVEGHRFQMLRSS